MSVWCAAIYKHTSITKNGVFPCCRSDEKICDFDGNLNDILNHPRYKKIRTQMENGIRINGCEKCIIEEECGKKSWRQVYNERNGTNNTVELKDLEIAFDNICNLACHACSVDWSSQWGKILNPDKSLKEFIWNTPTITNISKINYVKFLGGEPLINRRHRDFLKSIDDLSNLHVQYVTNGTQKLKKEDHILFSKCASVSFNVSIDGFGKLNEKVRPGRNNQWSLIENFINEIQKYEYNLTVQTLLHQQNFYGILDLYNWVKKINANWDIRVCHNPKHLALNNLSLDNKKNLIKMLEKIPNSQWIINFLNV